MPKALKWMESQLVAIGVCHIPATGTIYFRFSLLLDMFLCCTCSYRHHEEGFDSYLKASGPHNKSLVIPFHSAYHIPLLFCGRYCGLRPSCFLPAVCSIALVKHPLTLVGGGMAAPSIPRRLSKERKFRRGNRSSPEATGRESE